MDNTRMPYAYRPQRRLYLAVAPLLVDDGYLNMRRAEFIEAVMKATGGSSSPTEVSGLYDRLFDEAGVAKS